MSMKKPPMEGKQHDRNGNSSPRREFIGGSDARIMGRDEKALVRRGQEKCGEVGPDVSDM
jgi:hypothetical protein